MYGNRSLTLLLSQQRYSFSISLFLSPQLFDILGYDQFEAASALIQDRAEWILWHKKYLIDPAGVRGDRVVVCKGTQQQNGGQGRGGRVSI